jgi:hypothetical protein
MSKTTTTKGLEVFVRIIERVFLLKSRKTLHTTNHHFQMISSLRTSANNMNPQSRIPSLPPLVLPDKSIWSVAGKRTCLPGQTGILVAGENELCCGDGNGIATNRL